MKHLRQPRIALAIGLLALAIAALYPPWEARISGVGRVACGYGLLFDAPPNTCGGTQYDALFVQIDMGKLALEWAAIAAVTGAIVVMQRKES